MKSQAQDAQSQFSGFVQGWLSSHDVPVKTLPVHKSTLSRFFNGRLLLTERQIFEVGFYAGVLVGRRMAGNSSRGASTDVRAA